MSTVTESLPSAMTEVPATTTWRELAGKNESSGRVVLMSQGSTTDPRSELMG